MLRWIYSHSLKNMIRNEVIKKELGVAPIEDKMREYQLRWLGHVRHRPHMTPLRRCEIFGNEWKRKHRKPRKSWKKVICGDLSYLNLHEDIALNRME